MSARTAAAGDGPYPLPEGWRWVKLGEVAEINPRDPKPAEEAEISFVGMAQLDATTASAKPLETRSFSEVSKGYTVFRNHDVLVAKITPCWENGKIGQAELDHEVGVGSTEFHVVRPGGQLDSRYILHFLRQSHVRATGELRMTGSAGQRRVPAKYLSDLKIPLAPLSEQRRIVGILDVARGCVDAEFQKMELAKELPSAVFERCFAGKEYDRQSLGGITSVTSGITKGRKTSEPTRPVPYLAVANVQAASLKLDMVKDIEVTEKEIERYKLLEGDLLLTEGGDPDKLGRGTLWNSEIPLCLHQNHIFRVRVKEDGLVTPEYLSGFISSREARSYFLRSAKQTTGIASINMGQLKKLSVPVPSMDDQVEYAVALIGVRGYQSKIANEFSLSEKLFSSLQSRAFRGEL